MALRFERRHLPFRTWYHKRVPGGSGIATPEEDCCLLLLSDTGAETDDFLLLQDGCLLLLGCPLADECCFLLLSDPGTGVDEFLLLMDIDGSSCLELLNCNQPPAENDFLFLSDPADEFLFLSGPADNFEFLE